MSTAGARVLVVGDDPRFRTSIARVLRRASLDPIEAPDGRRALALARENAPAAVLIDIALPDIHGFEVCRELRERHGEAVAIVLVSGDQVETHDRIAGLLIGADEYLVKPVDDTELLARLRRLLARANGHAPVGRADSSGDLTARELEVLGLLAQGYGATEIATRLVISPKTVSSHLQHVLAKLGVHSRAQAVARAYEVGLITVGEFEAHTLAAAGVHTPAA